MSNPVTDLGEMCFVCLRKPSTIPPITLYRIPTDEKLKLLWMEACGLAKDDYTTERKVCSQHFTDNCFNTLNSIRYLLPDSIPTIFETVNFNGNVSNLNPALLFVKNIINIPNQQLVTLEFEKFSIFMYRIHCPKDQDYPVKWFCYLCSTFILSENAVKLHLNKCPPRNLDSGNAQASVDEQTIFTSYYSQVNRE